MKKNQPPPTDFVSLNEEGWVFQGDSPIRSTEDGWEVLKNLHKIENGSWVSTFREKPVFVEVFDEALVALDVEFEEEKKSWRIELRYEGEAFFNLDTLRLDEWDRFHGRTTEDIPFVFSRQAQENFFSLMNSFDDESITWKNQRWILPPLFEANPPLDQAQWWSDIYKTEENPRWNLAEPAEVLKDMLPRLKLAKSRILVLGCGEGHDAAHFAKDGHLVTALDISPEAIDRARNNYSTLTNLKFEVRDLFDWKPEDRERYDVIFEHTCYCAINPSRREELVRLWHRLLVPGGSLMGVFFVMDKYFGPPYGGSEWEIRQRLKKNFDFLFWGRWRQSLPRRQGRELFVYARKKFT